MYVLPCLCFYSPFSYGVGRKAGAILPNPDSCPFPHVTLLLSLSYTYSLPPYLFVSHSCSLLLASTSNFLNLHALTAAASFAPRSASLSLARSSGGSNISSGKGCQEATPAPLCTWGWQDQPHVTAQTAPCTWARWGQGMHCWLDKVSWWAVSGPQAIVLPTPAFLPGLCLVLPY